MPVDFKGRMQVFLNGDMIYSKGGFNATDPQPRPGEVATLVDELFPQMPLTAAEGAAFEGLHAEQIARGQNKH